MCDFWVNFKPSHRSWIELHTANQRQTLQKNKTEQNTTNTIVYRFNPMIPAKLKFVAIDEFIVIRIKHAEYLFNLLIRNDVNVAFVVAEQGAAYHHEFIQRQ